MKSQFKRFSKSTLSVVLAICMLVSCVTVGLIATNAAQDNSEALGANVIPGQTIYYDISNSGVPNWWTNDTGSGSSRVMSIKFGSGSWANMTYVSDTLFSYTVPAGTNTDKVSFGRGSSGNHWNSFETTFSGNGKVCFYQTGQSSGSWGYKSTKVKDHYFYFDNSNGFLNHTNKYLVIGHDSFYRIHKLNNISGTSLYYCQNTYDWSDSLYVGVFSENDDWQSGSDPKDVNNKNWENDVAANADGYKAIYSGSYEFNDGNSVLLSTASAANNTLLTPTYLSGYSALNKDLTIKTAIKSGSTYAESSTKAGTFSASSAKKINGNGSSTSSSVSQTTGTGTLTTARTNTATISQTTSSGYTFKGWKAGSLDTSGSSLTTGTYSFTNSGSDATVYAYYEEDTPTCTLTLDKTTKQTINIGETFDLTVTSANCSGSASNLSISSSSSSYVSATLKSTGANSRTYTIKALKPTSSDITLTAVCSADSDENNPTLKVAVRTPQFSLSYSPSSIPATGSSTATPTVSINTSYANSESTSSNLSYSITNGSSYATINSSNGTVTSTTTAGSVTAKVSGTITYNGVSYTTAEGTATITVSALPSVYIHLYKDNVEQLDKKMTYDSDLSSTKNAMIFKYTAENITGSKDHYLKIYDGSHDYKPNSVITTDYPISGDGLSGTQSSESTKLTTGAAGTYVFYFDTTNHKFYVEYPHTVTFDANGHGTAPAAQVVNYGGKATTPTAPTASGWTFGGWYKEDGCSNAWDFSTETVTTDKTLYAKWTQDSYAITYPTETNFSISNKSHASSAHYGDTVSFTVTASSGYRITGVTYTPTGGSAQNCTAGSNNTYSFTMPAANVTISVSTVQTYTVKLTAGEGFASIQYKKNSSGTYASYTSGTTLTVDKNTDVYFSVTYSTGYQYSSKTNLTVVTANTVFRTGAVSANVTATLTAEKIPYALTGSVSPAHGTVTFYSDSTCETQITTATYQQTVYAKYTPADGYVLKNFTRTSNGTSTTFSHTNNVGSFTMPAYATSVVATVVLQYSVTYYVDMHDNNVSSLNITLCSNMGGTVLKKANGENCTADLTRVNASSKVYSATIDTPVTQNGSSYNDLYVKVTFNGTSYPLCNLPGSKVATLASTHEMWLEAENEESTQLTVNYSTRSTSTVPEGSRRIYVAKPYSWETSETNWATLGIYHWGEYTDIGWSNGIRMNYLGNSGSDGYHYYYADIPKAINGNKVSNIIFQGWNSTNPAAGTSPNAQTGNIENIPDSANFFILSKDGSAFVGTKSDEDAIIPNYTRYVSSVAMNKTETTAVNIKPTFTGESISFTSNGTGVVTVDSNGNITPVGRGTTTITVKIMGTIGSLLTTEDTDHHDYLTYTVSVTVKDPTQFNGFEIMSLESQTYEVKIPNLDSNGEPVDTGGTLPGYFDMANVVMTVEGIRGVASSTSSAIITQTSTASVSGIGTVCTAFTVQYAKANSLFENYGNISIIGKVTTKSIRRDAGDRYGHDHWEEDGTTKTYTTSRVIDNGIETATTEGIPFDNTKTTYSDIFAAYQYVDVTFTFNYDEYVPKVVDGMIQYPYDADWAAQSGSHTTKTVKVSNFEIRNLVKSDIIDKTSESIVPAKLTLLVTGAAQAMGVMPESNYYNYKIDADTIPLDEISKVEDENQVENPYAVNVTVNMSHSVKQYKVYVNGDQIKDSNNNPLTYTYQQYAEPSVQNPADWYAVDDRNSTDTTNAPLLATGVNSYKFRVKGSAKSTNTYLRTAAATNPHGNDFLRSEVDFSHYEVTHQGSDSENMKEYLMQNFYIADFFSPSEVLDPNSYSGKGKFGPAYKVETVTESTSTSSGNITVYFIDSLDWNDIHVYYWGENINNVNWPGSVMTQSGTDEDGKKIYSAVIPGTAEGVIFTGNNNQTVDITNNIANGSHWKSKNEIVRNGIPYDDAQFVGGGVVYYSMNGATENNQGTPFANAVSSGYVGNDGKINEAAIKNMLKANIEAQYAKDNIAGAVGENEAMKIAYGTEIAATKNKEGGFNTGIIYRYLPLNQYKRDGNGTLLAPDQDGNYAYDVNTNTFRYSNSLQSYQYVYASGNENKETNTGKNMRLYSYFVYSYTAYNQETNVPETRYEIVISDNYSDASTYWEGNPNPDPSN